jgi:hypothetical protein
MITFDAPWLVVQHTSELLMKLTRNVVINGIQFVAALKHILQDMSELGPHTSIVHITPNTATRYT